MTAADSQPAEVWQSTSFKPSDVLSRDERALLMRKSDLHGAALVMANWLAIFGLLWIAARWPSVGTFLLVWVLLPGRQLGLAVLMHEAGHGSLFASAAANRWIGQWFCALPTLGDLSSYAWGHAEHHRQAGTPNDPDLPNYAAYPVSGKSFRRKVIRDLTGQTGLKLLVSLLRSAYAHGKPPKDTSGARDRYLLLLKLVAVQLLLACVLMVFDIGWTWWLWFATFMTSHMLVVRLRQVAEHAGVSDPFDPDPRRNTRTVEAPLWQRALMAPHGVNYHMEHHFMAGVPCYRLPALRRLLKDKGWLAGVPECRDYLTLLRHMVRA